LSVDATPALFSQETLAARRMLEHVGQFGIQPQKLAADKAYGSGEFLAWLLARNIQPHIPVIDHRHQTQGRFTRERFRYEPKENVYYCPEGKALHYRGRSLASAPHVFCFTIRTRSLGGRPAGLSNLRVQRHLGAPHHVPGSGARVVRRNGRSLSRTV